MGGIWSDIVGSCQLTLGDPYLGNIGSEAISFFDMVLFRKVLHGGCSAVFSTAMVEETTALKRWRQRFLIDKAKPDLGSWFTSKGGKAGCKICKQAGKNTSRARNEEDVASLRACFLARHEKSGMHSEALHRSLEGC